MYGFVRQDSWMISLPTRFTHWLSCGSSKRLKCDKAALELSGLSVSFEGRWSGMSVGFRVKLDDEFKQGRRSYSAISAVASPSCTNTTIPYHLVAVMLHFLILLTANIEQKNITKSKTLKHVK